MSGRDEGRAPQGAEPRKSSEEVKGRCGADGVNFPFPFPHAVGVGNGNWEVANTLDAATIEVRGFRKSESEGEDCSVDQ